MSPWLVRTLITRLKVYPRFLAALPRRRDLICRSISSPVVIAFILAIKALVSSGDSTGAGAGDGVDTPTATGSSISSSMLLVRVAVFVVCNCEKSWRKIVWKWGLWSRMRIFAILKIRQARWLLLFEDRENPRFLWTQDLVFFCKTRVLRIFFFVCLGCKAILKYTCSVIFVLSFGSSKIQPAFPVIQVYYTVRFLSTFHSWTHIIITTEPSLHRSQVYMPSWRLANSRSQVYMPTWRIANSTLYYKQRTELCIYSYKDVSEVSYSCKCSWRQQLSLSFLELSSVSRKFVR